MGSRLAIALVASAGVLLAACGSSSTSSRSPTPAAAMDSCLVGTWTTVALSENSPANDEDIKYSGGADQVFTITAKGAVTIDNHATQQIAFVSAGETFTATVAGTGRGTLRSLPGGTFLYEPSVDDTMTTTVVDSNGVPLGPPLADLAFEAFYACTPGRSFTYYKAAVNHMIDGPKVTLTAGNSTT